MNEWWMNERLEGKESDKFLNIKFNIFIIIQHILRNAIHKRLNKDKKEIFV